MSGRKSVLLLCRMTRDEAGNVADHIRALTDLSEHDVHAFNPVDRPDAAALLDLDEFDAVVLHYTIVVVVERYLPRVLREKIARYRGLKIQFIQDEYRWIDAVTAVMRELGIDILFTCVPEHEIPKVYARVPRMRTVTTLPGYVPDDLLRIETPPIAGRPIDVGYRGRTVPFWLGRLAQEKASIGEGFAARAEAHGLDCDISAAEEERIYGADWYRFLSRCKATLGTESGASIADFDGSIEARARAYLVRHANASFEEVHREALAPFEGNVVINTVSPRVFEAAGLRTTMILFPGEYSGTVQPWVHYVPLEKDFSNLATVAERIRDVPFLEEMTERAYADLIASGRYSLRRLVEQFDEVVAEHSSGRGSAEKPAYRRAVARRRRPSLRSAARLRYVAGKAAQPGVMTSLVVRDPAVRRLARLAYGDATLRGHPGLSGDLWRLAALRRGVRLGLFGVEASLEREGQRLVLTSTAGARGDGAAPSGAVCAALETRTLRELVWDHSALGPLVPLVAANVLPSVVGEHGVPGGYSFEALVALGHQQPSAVADAFGPLLGTAAENQVVPTRAGDAPAA